MGLDALTYYAFRLAGAAAPHIPLRLGYRIGAQLGTLAYLLSGSRAVVEDNIAHVLREPPSSPRVRRAVRQIFLNQGKNYFDLLRVAALDSEAIKGAVRELHGMEHLERALAHGRGVVLASAHFGNIDVAGQIIAVMGYTLTAIAEHLRPERLFQYVRAQRESHGLHFIPIDGSLRPVFRALQRNEIVATALDRNTTDEGRVVEFFGEPARLPDGYLRLALRTGAALVVGFSRRLADDTYAVTVEPEVELQRSGNLEQDIQVNMRRVLSIWETYLERYPEQWVLFQPVWLSRLPASAIEETTG